MDKDLRGFFIFLAVLMVCLMVYHTASLFSTPPAPTDTAAEPGCTLPREEGEPLP